MTFRRSSPHAGARWFVLLGTVVAMTVLIGATALASHPEASLPGSNFEIDVDANLKVDDAAPSIDWASFTEIRANDALSGTGDDSYSGGTKEDSVCPGETTGSIPPNKSDLLTFHVYSEAGSGSHPGYLNLAWSRVSDPSGTTLMDFEFNQSDTDCASGPNKVRTAGDLLIEYAIDQGGSRADITARTWSGSAWGAPADLDVPSATCGGNPCAAGTINSSTIPAAESDGLISSGSKQARTFGEAQLDLRLIFQANKCTSFGSAMLKSRSSDSFTSQLKDFIAPVGIDLTNCGKVIIRKVTDPAGSTATFNFSKTFGTDPSTSNTFTMTGASPNNVKTFNNVLFGSGLTVSELLGTNLPTGWDFVSVDCSASTGVTPSDITGAVVTFAIDDEDDVLDCTYTNRARGTIIVEKVTSDGMGTFGFTSSTLSPASFNLITTASGAAGKVSRTFSDLAPGTYDVAETVPTGWNLTSATCSDSSPITAISLQGGETITCTFTNARERGAIIIDKERKHAASGPGDHPHNGVNFTVTGGSTPTGGVGATTSGEGRACIDNLVVSSLAGTYTVTESVPTGYVVVSANPQTGITVTESTCATTNTIVYFDNMPLTDITVSVNSQIDGGTASTIDCTPLSASANDATTGANGDGSHTVLNLQPGTYTCEIVIDP